MARKRRSQQDQPPGTAASGLAVPAGAGGAPVPPEVGQGNTVALLLALLMFLAPAMGSPHEEMLQDTLKSMVVSFMALAAALLFLWQQRRRSEPLRWHAVLWLPLALLGYALGSMAWSHPYLGGAEAVRWFIFSLLLWLALNTLSLPRLPALAWGIHLGAVVASLWAALQFWTDFSFFPQGPNPASTFVNRNFFAEFAVCTLPFSAWLLARARQGAQATLLVLTGALVIVAILMTGTRSALIALWIQLLLVLPLIAWRCRRELAMAQWPLGMRLAVGAGLLALVAALGSIPTGNARIVAEGRGLTAVERAFKRTQSIQLSDESLGLRMQMWKATLTLIRAHPFAGVGAGAWEANIPLYQPEGIQLETDYYAHNEYLQLVAEYGLLAWAFLLALAAWLLRCAWRTWHAQGEAARTEQPARAVLLCSLLALFIVSNIGFPWRMATTAALFALCLGALAASEARLAAAGRLGARAMRWGPGLARAAIASCLVCIVLAVYVAQRAAEAERKIVRAVKLALTITASGQPNHKQWDAAKREMLRLIAEGIERNRHYRKITPIVADELARWGDWRNAIWIWDSVLGSRPHIVVIQCNIARGFIAIGQPHNAWPYLERAKRIQPRAAAVRSLEVMLLGSSGRDGPALQLAQQSISEGIVDFEMAHSAFVLARRLKDVASAQQAADLMLQRWPDRAMETYMMLGKYYAEDVGDASKAREAFTRALGTASPAQRPLVEAQIPAEYRQRPAARPPQRSASSK